MASTAAGSRTCRGRRTDLVRGEDVDEPSALGDDRTARATDKGLYIAYAFSDGVRWKVKPHPCGTEPRPEE